MATTMSFLCLLFAAFLTSVRSASIFIKPGVPGITGDYHNNRGYKVGDIIDVEWQTDFDFVDIWVWQDYPPLDDGLYRYYQVNLNTTDVSMTWEISFDNFITDIPEGEEAVFSFALYNAGITANDAWSHYFNVSRPRETSTSPSITETTAATATSTLTVGSAGSDKKESVGLSSGELAGISLGATFGGLLLIAGAALLGWRYFNCRAPGGRYQPRQHRGLAVEQVNPPSPEYTASVRPVSRLSRPYDPLPDAARPVSQLSQLYDPSPVTPRPVSRLSQPYDPFLPTANEPWSTSMPTSIPTFVQHTSHNSRDLYGEGLGYDQEYGHHYDPTANYDYYYSTPHQAPSSHGPRS